jgi:hypothetical protein
VAETTVSSFYCTIWNGTVLTSTAIIAHLILNDDKVEITTRDSVGQTPKARSGVSRPSLSHVTDASLTPDVMPQRSQAP